MLISRSQSFVSIISTPSSSSRVLWLFDPSSSSNVVVSPSPLISWGFSSQYLGCFRFHNDPRTNFVRLLKTQSFPLTAIKGTDTPTLRGATSRRFLFCQQCDIPKHCDSLSKLSSRAWAPIPTFLASYG